MNGWITIFRTGRHTDNSGVSRYYSRDDLDHRVQAYNPEHHEAPLVIGHPETDSPAYGWIEKLRRVGDRLQAKPKQVHEAAEELVKDGHYKYVSPAFYADGSLRHVGLLGATPPAVKGLGAVQFGNGDDYQSYEFADTQEEDQGEASMNELEKLKKELAEKEAKLKASEEAKAKAEEGQAAEKERADKAEAAQAETDQKFSEHRAAEQAEKREAQFNELVEAEKLMPGDKKLVMGLAEKLASSESLEFSEGGKTVKQEPEAALWKLLGSRAPGNLTGEFAESPGDGGESDAPSGDYAKTF